MNKSTKPNPPRRRLAKKSREARAKFQLVRESFRTREAKIRADLEEASSIWRKLGERFKWRQSLP